MIVYLSLVVCLLGLVVYLVSNNPPNNKPAEVGRIMFFCGLLVFLLTFAGHGILR